MVETRASGPGEEGGEEGEEESARASAAQMVDAAVERAKRKAVEEHGATLAPNMKTKKRAGILARVGQVAAAKERRVQEEEAERKAAEGERRLGWLEGVLKRTKGQLVAKPEAQTVLHHYYHLLCRDGLKAGAAVTEVAARHGMSRNTVYELVQSFEANDGEIVVKDGAGRGGTDKTSLLPETHRQIEQYIAANNTIGKAVYARDIWRWLKHPPGRKENPSESTGEGGAAVDTVPEYDRDREAIDVSETTVKVWLAKMGYKRMEGSF
ncbi:unnamed protein product [Ectocarpus fasciculatus]